MTKPLSAAWEGSNALFLCCRTSDELLKAANDALYTVKREGRNRVVSSDQK